MEKKELRKIYKEKRKALGAVTRHAYSLQLATEILEHLKPDGLLHIFLPIKHLLEPDTFALIKNIRQYKPKLKLASSVSHFEDNRLSHFLLQENHLALNNWGIPEPKEPRQAISTSDINQVIIPLLVADKWGNRLGYGKGFYDRFLADLPEESERIGINFFPCIEEKIPHAGHDIPLHKHLSPGQIVTFKP